MRVKLKDVAVEFKEKSSDKSISIGLEHLESNKITIDKYDTNGNNTFTKAFKRGQILFGRRRAYLHKAAVAPFDGICSGDIIVIEAIKNKIFPAFLPFVIQNEEFFNYAVEKSAGSLSPRVKWEHLKEYEFELPDFEEQKRLANILWKIENIKSSIKEQIKKSEYLLFNYYSHIYRNMDGNYQSIKSMVEIQNKSEIKAGDQIPYGKYKFFTSGEKEGYYNSYLLNGQFLILNTGGSMLCQYYNGPFAYSTDALVIKPKEDLIKFIYYHLLCNQKYYDEKFFRGSGLRHLNKKEFLSSEIKIPEKNKIIYIVNFMDNISKIIASLNNQKIYLQELERKIIKEALNV